ncbi:MAG: type II secretion system F family protein [Anaerolineales bacterium]|nr:type II secretion system F family protein [Anaerolineales bacterium]
MAWVLIIILVVIMGGAIFLVFLGLREAGERDPLQARLAEFAARGESATLEEIELSQPLTERVIYPMARRFGEIALRFTPQNAIQTTQHKLELAGNPTGLDPTLFWSLRLAGISLGIFMVILAAIAPEGSFLKGNGLLYGIPASVLGFYLPELWLRSKINKRQTEIRKAMPDALDLLTICVEAGLGFDAAMSKVYDKWDNPLGAAFGRVIREIQLGKLRRDALRDMASRMGIPEMTSFVAAVIQSEQLGVSMAKVLRIQSDQMRLKRRQRAEEEAHKAPVKMLFPMAILIFPTICIVLMTPAFLMLMRSALAGVFGF